MLLIVAMLCGLLALTLVNHAGMCTTHAQMVDRTKGDPEEARQHLFKALRAHKICVVFTIIGSMVLGIHAALFLVASIAS
jgi:ABC-type phosphate transport system permease subunit